MLPSTASREIQFVSVDSIEGKLTKSKRRRLQPLESSSSLLQDVSMEFDTPSVTTDSSKPSLMTIYQYPIQIQTPSLPITTMSNFQTPLFPDPTPSMQVLNGRYTDYQPTHEGSLTLLQKEAFKYQAAQVKENQERTQTAKIYARHVAAYEKWWLSSQAQHKLEEPSWVPISPFPITVVKVCLYLEYEMKRPKRKHQSSEIIHDTTVGKSSISVTISALENYRLTHAYLYPNDSTTHTPLRTDLGIRLFEESARRAEPERIISAQAIKAAGSSADTYSSDELHHCSMWGFATSGPRNLWVRLRDRAMLLFSCGMAFRGDSLRMLLWSDLFLSEMPLHDVQVGFKIPVLAVLANNAKHNQMGRLDEHGAIRHREVEVCPVGGLAFLLFATFHIIDMPLPDFAPVFDTPGFGEYGYREWYDYHLFPSKDPKVEMSYSNHRERVAQMHSENNVSITKVTHAGRSYAAQTSRSHGADVNETKALGGWSNSGSFRACYDRTFPTDAMLAAATFSATKKESYSLPRSLLEPPQELLQQMFPWAEDELEALKVRARIHSNKVGDDIALRHFLRLLIWLRKVLIQDAAIMFTLYPSLSIFSYSPFTSKMFREFANTALPTIRRIEEEARVAYKDLPDRIVQSLQGLTTNLLLEQRLWQDQVLQHLEESNKKMARLEIQFEGSGRKKSRKASSRVVTRPTSPPPNPPVNTQDNPIGATISLSNIGTLTVLTQTHPPSIQSSPAFSAIPTETPYEKEPMILDPCARRTQEVIQRYGKAVFELHQPWSWERGDLIPSYKHQPVTCITDIWTEYTDGLAGHISLRELKEKWDTKWRRGNASQKSETSRRLKVVSLIEELAKLPHWNTRRALAFLQEKYSSRSPRQFADYISKSNNRTDLLQLAHITHS